MKIQTVLGEISEDEAGVTLPHEHVFIDLHCYWKDPRDRKSLELAKRKVTISTLGDLRENPEAIEDNMVVDSVKDVSDELQIFKTAGGRTIVDATTVGIGRNPRSLKKAAEKSGVNLVAGCGYYVSLSQPKPIRNWPAGKMTRRIIDDITKGIDDTGIRAGVIGEIGALNDEPDKIEIKSLAAAGRAQEETGAGVVLHTNPRAVHILLDILQDNGADLKKVAAAHADSLLSRISTGYPVDGKKERYSTEERMQHYKDLAGRGVMFAFDGFGVEYWNVSKTSGELYSRPRDIQRVEQIAELVKEGLVQNILISQDNCFKSLMTKFGGFGWEHTLKRIVPLLGWAGLSEEEVDQIIVGNPKKLLAF